MTASSLPPPLALTMGEPAGIGGELTLKAWRALRASGPVFYAIDDPRRLAALGAEVETIGDPAQAGQVFDRKLPVLPVGGRIEGLAGEPQAAHQPFVVESIRLAVMAALSGAASGVVTNPIQKRVLLAAGFEFPGHTEYLQALTAAAPLPAAFSRRGAVMMLAAPDLRTVPVTVHVSLAGAAAALTAEAIVAAGLVVDEALRADFGIARPRLAVAGLNPHAGEGGEIGREDEEIVAPAVDRLCAAGVDARGPFSADTMFHAEARRHYDAALCMYHDQALIPVKTIAFHEAVNVTLGLPIVRTSPDHGTALDIAGTGQARADSLIAAMKLAAEIAARRAGS